MVSNMKMPKLPKDVAPIIPGVGKWYYTLDFDGKIRLRCNALTKENLFDIAHGLYFNSEEQANESRGRVMDFYDHYLSDVKEIIGRRKEVSIGKEIDKWIFNLAKETKAKYGVIRFNSQEIDSTFVTKVTLEPSEDKTSGYSIDLEIIREFIKLHGYTTPELIDVEKLKEFVEEYRVKEEIEKRLKDVRKNIKP